MTREQQIDFAVRKWMQPATINSLFRGDELIPGYHLYLLGLMPSIVHFIRKEFNDQTKIQE